MDTRIVKIGRFNQNPTVFAIIRPKSDRFRRNPTEIRHKSAISVEITAVSSKFDGCMV